MSESSRPIHPRYSNLPPTVTGSEVLTSNFIGLIAAAGKTDIQAKLIRTMEEMGNILQKNGLSCPDESLEVFSEVVLSLDESEDKELGGRFLNSLISFGGSLIKQTVIPSSVIEKMSILADSMSASVYELKDITSDIKGAIPRKLVKASRNKKGAASNKPKPKDKQDVVTKDFDAMSAEEEEMDCEIVKSTSGNQETKQSAIDPEIEAEIANNAAICDVQRRNCRDYYWSPDFEKLQQETRDSVVTYYINNILHVNPDILRVPDTLAMLYDLINKDTILTVLNKGKANKLTNKDIEVAVEEAMEAINACSKWYGGYSAKSYLSGDLYYLAIEKASTSA